MSGGLMECMSSWLTHKCFTQLELMKLICGLSLHKKNTKIKTPQKVCVKHLKSPKREVLEVPSPNYCKIKKWAQPYDWKAQLTIDILDY